MFHENELLSDYGRECRKRQAFWEQLIPYDGTCTWKNHKKKRMPFAKAFGMLPFEFYEWAELNGIDTVTLKQEYASIMKLKTNTVSNISKVHSNLVAECLNWEIPIEIDGYKPNREEETMITETQDQRRYLENRLLNEYGKHNNILRNHFHIDREGPSTVKEAIDLFKSGKVTLNEKYIERLNEDYEDDFGFDGYMFLRTLNWGYPEADRAGYKAAVALLDKAHTDAKDIIKVSYPEEGLKALKAFETATFH